MCIGYYVFTANDISNTVNNSRWYNPFQSFSSTDYEKKAAVDFVTCVRLLALSKNQEDCTPLKIKEIIGKDYFRLHVINKTADIEDCLPGNVNDH